MDVRAADAQLRSTIVLDSISRFRLVPLEGTSVAVAHADEFGNGITVEAFDDSLGTRWKRSLSFGIGYPFWMGGGRGGIRLLYEINESADSISIHGAVVDSRDGTTRIDRGITGFGNPEGSSNVGAIDVALSPDSSHIILFRYDYSGLRDSSDRSIELVAELVDAGWNRLGSARLAIPVEDSTRSREQAEARLTPISVGNDGRLYQFGFQGSATLRVTRLDVRTGTARVLESVIPGVDFRDTGRQLLGTRLSVGADQRVMVVAGRFDERKLQAMVLLGMDFDHDRIDYMKTIEVTPELARRRTGQNELEWFQLRDVIRLADGGIVLPLEQVRPEEVRVRDYNYERDRTVMKPGTGGSMPTYTTPIPTFKYSHSVFLHGDLLMFGFNASGDSIWSITQYRRAVTSAGEYDRTDSWRVEGDSLHCIYRNAYPDEVVASTISTRTGAMSSPRPLLETTMNSEHQHTTWFGPDNALIVLSLLDKYRLVRITF